MSNHVFSCMHRRRLRTFADESNSAELHEAGNGSSDSGLRRGDPKVLNNC